MLLETTTHCHELLPYLERVRFGMRRDVEVSRHAVDQNDAFHRATLAFATTHLHLLLLKCLGLGRLEEGAERTQGEAEDGMARGQYGQVE